MRASFHKPPGRARHSVRAVLRMSNDGAQGTDAPCLMVGQSATASGKSHAVQVVARLLAGGLSVLLTTTAFTQQPSPAPAPTPAATPAPAPAPAPTPTPRPPPVNRNYTILLDPARQDEYNWSRNLRLGMQVGLNIKADFKLAGQFTVSGSDPGPPGVGGVDRFYDDGYVRVDDTGNAGGYTSFWGYDNPDQIQNGQLILHATTSYTTAGAGNVDDEAFFGFELAYGGKIKRWGQGTLGWEFGFGLLPIEISEKQPLKGLFSRTTHSFDTWGIIVPDAPYEGPFTSGGSPTISDLATEIANEIVPGTVTGSRSLDVMLYSFKLGPTFHWQFNRRWGAMVGAGGALGFVTGDYKYDETLRPDTGGETQSRGKFSESDVVYGFYAGGTLLFRTHEPADIYLTIQYLSLDDVNFTGKGREAELQLGNGVYIGVGINWPF